MSGILFFVAVPLLLLVAAGIVIALVAFFRSRANVVLKVVVALVLAACVGGVALFVVELRTARIELVNNAQKQITDVNMETSDGGKGRWTKKVDALEPGASCTVSRMVPDLFLGEVIFVLDGKTFRHAKGGIACWGERLVLTITDNGTVEQAYRR